MLGAFIHLICHLINTWIYNTPFSLSAVYVNAKIEKCYYVRAAVKVSFGPTGSKDTL